jgi:nicotinate-nucleotide--dimethylbenzimidazole phosphoribosyltransferase
MRNYKVAPVEIHIREELAHKINTKTKPLGSLGVLEDIALRVGLIQNTVTPSLKKPHIVVFAADHGIAREGVSAYPQDVTWQMVLNFLNEGAAINVFCRQHNINLSVVDAGVNYDFPVTISGIIRNKAGKSTESFLHVPAMTMKTAQSCFDTSASIVQSIHDGGCNVIGFGEMGIGNTSSAAVLMSVLCGLPIDRCVGRGTGLDEAGLQRKLDILRAAVAKHGRPNTILETLAAYGGFEIAQMTGAILKAAELRMVVLIDGFISTVACLVAQALESRVKDYCIFCHQSQEKAHKELLGFLNAKPVLNLNMRLGEGTGVAVAFPIIQSAVNFLNEMASFESAGVSDKS